MSYIRGKYYSYTSEYMGKQSMNLPSIIPMDVFDELVVMRFHELEETHKAISTEKRAMKKYKGNIGLCALLRHHGKPCSFCA